MQDIFSQHILYESPSWMAVNKPAGISVERQPGAVDTLEDQALSYLAATTKRPFLGIVHRLDRPTSGIVLLAKKKSALAAFNELFRQGKIQKTYLALTSKSPEKEKNTLTHYLLKDTLQKKALIASPSTPGAVSAVLDYRIMKQTSGVCLLEVRLHTGKFHQIRAQLSAIGCPIIGDTLYGGAPVERLHCIALHAWQLQLVDPATGALVTLEAPPSQLFEGML